MLTYNCNEPVYVKLVEVLYAENYINLNKVDVNWDKTDQERNPIKWLTAVVWGLQISQAKDVKENFKYKNEQTTKQKQKHLGSFSSKQTKKGSVNFTLIQVC